MTDRGRGRGEGTGATQEAAPETGAGHTGMTTGEIDGIPAAQVGVADAFSQTSMTAVSGQAV